MRTRLPFRKPSKSDGRKLSTTNRNIQLSTSFVTNLLRLRKLWLRVASGRRRLSLPAGDSVAFLTVASLYPRWSGSVKSASHEESSVATRIKIWLGLNLPEFSSTARSRGKPPPFIGSVLASVFKLTVHTVANQFDFQVINRDCQTISK